MVFKQVKLRLTKTSRGKKALGKNGFDGVDGVLGVIGLVGVGLAVGLGWMGWFFPGPNCPEGLALTHLRRRLVKTRIKHNLNLRFERLPFLFEKRGGTPFSLSFCNSIVH